MKLVSLDEGHAMMQWASRFYRGQHCRKRMVVRTASLAAVYLAGCAMPTLPTGNSNDNTVVDNQNTNDNVVDPVFNNTTDSTNGGSVYLGSQACRSCHPEIDEQQLLHGHANILSEIVGQPTSYPEAAERAGVPEPPDGFTWNDIPYVIGGYTRTARFVGLDGYVLTNDSEGVDTQWNLSFPPSGTTPHFAAYEDEGNFDSDNRKPFGFDCFACHVTGAMPLDEANPRYQDNRPGIAGTWEEAGVQCEACHGPGSRHVAEPEARDMYVNVEARACGTCHNHSYDSDDTKIRADSGFIHANSQYAELLASGGHADFDCVDCHDPHVSANYQRDTSHVKECTDCHEDITLALHTNVVYIRGDYVERVSCESCHMPYATLSGALAGDETVGDEAHVADTRTHIFRINPAPEDRSTMFNANLTEVAVDDEGRAAATVDYVCLRCHNGKGNAFLLTVRSAGLISDDMHLLGW